MKKILAIGGSNSSMSINKAFATFVANQLKDAEVRVIDLNDFEMPLFGVDLQASIGIPTKANQFLQAIAESDGIVLSLAEHNGMISTAFKNLWDWTSRIEPAIWQSKPMLLMAASPGGRGGASVLNTTSNLIPFYGGNVTAQFSLPHFFQNFSAGGITNDDLKIELQNQIKIFTRSLNQ